MYCPNCGKTTSPDQKFCRSCGLAMDKIAQSLAEQLLTRTDDITQAPRNTFERLGRITFTMFGVIVGGFLLYALFVVIYEMILIEGKILQGIGVLAVLLCITFGLLAVYFFARANEVQTETKRRLQQQGDIVPPTTGKLLPEPHLETVPSVTEQTTELLAVENRKAR